MSSLLVSNVIDKTNIIFPQTKKNENNPLYKINNVISAIVTNIDHGKTTLKTKDNVMLQFEEEAINASCGDEVFLKVVSNDKNGVYLKQIDPFSSIKKSLGKNIDLDSLKQLMLKSDFIEPEENLLAPKTMQEINETTKAKMQQALKKVKNQLMYTSENMTKTAVAQLLANGISIEKISINVMNELIKEISESPKTRQQHLADKTDSAISSDLTKQVKDRLDDICNLNDETIAKILKGQKELTIENIYIEKYANANSENPSSKISSDELIESLEAEIVKTMKNQDIKVNNQNLETAKLLVKNEVKINKENMEKVEFLKNIKNRVDNESCIKSALSLMQSGTSPYELNIYSLDIGNGKDSEELEKSYENIIKDINNIRPMHIEKALEQSKILTIKSLQQILDEMKTEKNNDGDTYEKNSNISQKAISYRRQIAEICLKLTSESAMVLAKNNIRIDTLPLKQVLEHLREVEENKYVGVLEASDVQATSANKTIMLELFEHLRNIAPIHQTVAKKLLDEEIPFTIKQMSMATVQEKYEVFATRPNLKYHDNFSKIAKEIPYVLENMDIGVNEDSIRAAEILIKNNIEVNPENLYRIKLMDSKVNEVYERLNPFIAADMIKNKLNPYDMDINDVISYIDDYDEKFGENSLEKIAEHISMLEDKKEISEKERDSAIAIYRMLHQIKKDSGASLGFVLKACETTENLTLGKLLEASNGRRKIKKLGNAINEVADGETSQQIMETSEKSTIKQILDRTSRSDYAAYAIRRFGRYVKSNSLNTFLDENNKFEDMDMESAMIAMREIHSRKEVLDEQINSQFEDIKNKLKMPQDAIRFIQENKMPLTLDTIDTVKKHFADKRYFSNEINKLRDLLKDREIKNRIDKTIEETDISNIHISEKTNENAYKNLAEILDDIAIKAEDFEVIAKINLVKKATNIMSIIPNKTGGKNVPIMFNGKVTQINMHVLNEDIQDKADIFILIDAGSLGEVQILAKSNGDNVDLVVSAKDAHSLERLKKNEDILNGLISDAGYNVGKLSIIGGFNSHIIGDVKKEL